MADFGWSYPAGCTHVPDDEDRGRPIMVTIVVQAVVDPHATDEQIEAALNDLEDPLMRVQSDRIEVLEQDSITWEDA